MNIPKKLAITFYACINTFLSTNLAVHIHKVFNFARYQQEVNSFFLFRLSDMIMK